MPYHYDSVFAFFSYNKESAKCFVSEVDFHREWTYSEVIDGFTTYFSKDPCMWYGVFESKSSHIKHRFEYGK